MDLLTKALYGGVLPGALALLLAMLALWRASKGDSRGKLAVWAAPLAAAVGIAISFGVQFSGPYERWHRLVFTGPALLLIWSVGLMFPSANPARRRATWAGMTLAIAVMACVLMWPAILPQQAQWMHALPFAGAGLVAAVILPLAMNQPRPAEGLAIGVACALLAPIVLFCGNAKIGELLLPAAAAAAVSSLLALAIRGQRWEAWREAMVAGAMGTALLLPMWATVAWGYGYDLAATHAWALALPCLALPLVWAGRFRWLRARPLIAGLVAIILVGGVAAVGLALALSQTDTTTYDPGF